MDIPDEKKMGRLYALLKGKEEQSDLDAVAALRWAIFNLEQKSQEKQSDDLIFRLVFAQESKLNDIIDTGAFNEIIKGYLVAAMRDAGTDREEILSAVNALENVFEDTDAAAAREAYRNL